MFDELKQFKAICLDNTHTHTLTDYSTLAMCPRTARLTMSHIPLIGGLALLVCFASSSSLSLEDEDFLVLVATEHDQLNPHLIQYHTFDRLSLCFTDRLFFIIIAIT